jgi:hypothetical protein
VFKRLKQAYDHFYQTLEEGHYRAEPMSIWSNWFKPSGSKKLPETPQVAIGTGMLGTAEKLGNRFFWASIFAVLSIKSLMTTGIALAVAGAGFFGIEYYRCRKSAEDTITEVNFAGQTVQGKRRDLCRLFKAQAKLMNLTSAFKQASMASTADTIKEILDSVKEERSRVAVLERGRYSAKASVYDFSEPEIKLVNEPEQAPPAAADAGLRAAWENKREDEVVEKIIALERALPPHVIEKLRQKRIEPVAM